MNNDSGAVLRDLEGRWDGEISTAGPGERALDLYLGRVASSLLGDGLMGCTCPGGMSRSCRFADRHDQPFETTPPPCMWVAVSQELGKGGRWTEPLLKLPKSLVWSLSPRNSVRGDYGKIVNSHSEMTCAGG